jgi:hypothetical protein
MGMGGGVWGRIGHRPRVPCGAVAVSGMEVVWSFIWSSMAFFISFMLPCGSYIIIENAVPSFDRQCASVRFAWTMLLLSIIGAAVCTINSIRGFG